MYGTLKSEGRISLNNRDARMIQMMEIGRPVRAIAQLVGLDHEYCRKICTRLMREHDLKYVPDNTMVREETAPLGISEDSRSFRRYLSTKLNELALQEPNTSNVAAITGVLQRDQKYAKQRPFHHDWTLSQMERLAAALGLDFIAMMKEAINAV
jgi:hypothetical protein